MVALPVELHDEWKMAEPIPTTDMMASFSCSRLILATFDYVSKLFDQDQQALVISEMELEGLATSPLGQEAYAAEKPFYDMCLQGIQQELALLSESYLSAKPTIQVQPDQEVIYYYYQSTDGQHIYMHPLDTKILKCEFKSYDNFPKKLSAPVICIQESTIDEDLRKRCKYLRHLPISSDIAFCQFDLSGIVSEATLNQFNSILD